jgi:hypothetical protein
MPDWTDETLRPLDELARLAFPDGGVTGETLRRRGREGKLAVYRPGKPYLASLAGVRMMIEQTRVTKFQERPSTPVVPNSLGLTEADLASRALDAALEPRLDRQARKEAKRLPDEKRAREAHWLEMKERRRARAQKRYHTKKAERAKVPE